MGAKVAPQKLSSLVQVGEKGRCLLIQFQLLLKQERKNLSAVCTPITMPGP